MDIPNAAISANAIPRELEKGLRAGFFRYVTQPIRIHELLKTLDPALEFAVEATGRPGCKRGQPDGTSAHILKPKRAEFFAKQLIRCW